MTPTPARNSGRNTPRRPSGLAMVTPGGSIRRGRSSILTGSPAAEATPSQANGLELEQSEVVEEEALVDEDAEKMAPVPAEAADASDKEPERVNGDVAQKEPAKTNGIDAAESEPSEDKDTEAPRTPEKKTNSISRSPGTAVSRRSNDNPKTPRSVNRKALVEKVHVMIPAEPGSASKSPGKGEDQKAVANTIGTDADSDADADADADAEVDAEYEVDGDVVMQT